MLCANQYGILRAAARRVLIKLTFSITMRNDHRYETISTVRRAI